MFLKIYRHVSSIFVKYTISALSKSPSSLLSTSLSTNMFINIDNSISSPPSSSTEQMTAKTDIFKRKITYSSSNCLTTLKLQHKQQHQYRHHHLHHHHSHHKHQHQNSKQNQQRFLRHHHHHQHFHPSATGSHSTANRKELMRATLILFTYICVQLKTANVAECSTSFDTQGPTFTSEPLNRLEFTNSGGNRVDCTARGNPQPSVEWLDQDNNPVSTIPKVRHILANGSLYFPPFEADAFRQDVHWAIYRCIATNTVGTIVSRDITVKAIVNQRYEPEVQNPGGFLGSNVLIKCNIPSFVKEYVTVTSWLQEPSFNIYPSLEGDGKYHMLPTGELLIINITRTDAQRTYRCRTHHQLTQEAVISANVGRIQLTEMRETVPPIMNEKVVTVTVRQNDPIVIPCVAYANPSPTYRWHTRKNNKDESIETLLSNGRAIIRYGTLTIQSVKKSDGGTYYCTATNSEGSETLEMQLSVTSPLSAHIQPARQTVDLGKSADLTCTISGFPQQNIWWLKDGQSLRTGSRVRLLSKEHIKITSITKDDKGMYQCFVKNEQDSAQGTAELRLGEVSPQLVYKFIEQTMQPGPSVSLKCSAAGNPTPQITWNLDGFPLPNNDRLMIGQYVTMFGDVISHVNISAVKSEDGGEYECVAKSRAGMATHSARLNIYGMPYVRPMPLISAVAGKTLTIKCPVAGYPIESIIWEKVPPKITPFSFARDLNVGDRTSIQCVVSTGDLPLTFTWLKDGQPIIQTYGSGSVTSGGGSSSSVTGGSSITGNGPGKLSSSDVSSSGGSDLMIIDTTNDHGNSAGNGGNGNLDGTITIRQNDDFTSALSIISVTRAQGGTYACRVQNDAATVTHSAQLRVNVPPRISPFSFEDDITEGMRTQLMCSSSQGDQPFNITWLKDGRPIRINGNNGGGSNSGGKMIASTSGLDNSGTGGGSGNVINLSGNMNTGGGGGRNLNDLDDPTLTINEYAPFSSILSIHNVSSRHNGNYTCQITNRAGTVEFTALLSVAVPPRWLVEPQDQSAVLGNPVTITCKADGFPQPTVHWKQAIGEQSGEYRELNYAGSSSGIESHSNGSLIIPKVIRDHEGYFLCQASNGIGPGLSKLIKLTVHVGPHVTVRNKQVSVRRGDRVTLRCEADGDQPLDVSWRAKGNRIDPAYDIRYHLKNSPLSRGVVSELTIVQSALTDRGEYSCVASNAYGHDHAALHLQVQEPPNFPRNLHITELGSRSVTLAWTPNDHDPTANAASNYRESQPISNYILQYKEAQDVWHEHNNQKLLPGDKITAQIGSLKPATSYHFRLYAENHLGTSAPSDILHVQTDAEVPSGPPKLVVVEPLGPQQLLITWRPPERELWNGELLGYTIGYHKHGSSDSAYNYTKVGIPGGEGLNDFRLTGLDKYTQYAVTVSAFNIKGDGPPSEPVLAHTLEDVPSAPPQALTCIALTAQNVQVSWKAPPKENTHGIVQGYKLLYEPASIDTDYGNRETKITSALSTVLHGLQPYTNYSVQVLAFTRAGEGVSSAVVSCTTEEAVPDAPERVKSVVNSETSVIISWLPPRRPNGIVTKYNVYIRILDKGQEVKILKEVLPAHNRHFEVKELTMRETYEAWVTASTRIGQGPSTPVIKLMPSTTVPAAVISFGQTLSVSWRVDVKLACLYVGTPKPTAEWKVLNSRAKKQQRLEINNENTLTLRNVQRSHEGNYSCTVRNALGSDHIVYQLFVQVPPSSPELSVVSTTTTSVSLQWRVSDIGGASLRGFVLTYRREFGDWEEVALDRRANSYLLENLQCGTRYQFTIAAFNKIGSGSASAVETARTKGNKPISPLKHHLIRPNVTSVLLELASWQDGGCPILSFTIEFRRYGASNEWIVMSNNVAAQARYNIGDLEPATPYSLRITAHNNAGSTITEYYFETLNLIGLASNSNQDLENLPTMKSLFMDAHFLAVIIISCFGIILAIVGICFCFKNHPRFLFGRDDETRQSHVIDGKSQLSDQQQQREYREQFYATVRKASSQQSPRDSEAGLERIPEYSEDIYPYATFHLPDHENQSGNPNRKGCLYDSRENTLKIIRPSSGSGGCTPSSNILSGNTVGGPNLVGGGNSSSSGSNGGSSGGVVGGGVVGGMLNVSVGVGVSSSGSAGTGGIVNNSNGANSNTGTEKRNRRKSKAIKSESEEYDSLNSDSDLSGGINSRTESSSHLDDSATGSFASHAHSPGSRASKERLSVFTRPPLHKNQKYISRDLNRSPEILTTSESRPTHQIVKSCGGGVVGGGVIVGHKRTISNGNHSMDMPPNYRDFDPPPKQQQQQKTQQQQHQQQQQSIQHQQSSTTSTSTNCSNSSPSPITASSKIIDQQQQHQHESKLLATFITQSNPYSEILKCSPYQNVSQKYSLISSSAVRFNNNNNNSNQQFKINSKSARNFLLNSPSALKMLEMQQTSTCLNKTYGDFLTITPRRKGRLLGSSIGSANAGGAIPIPVNTSVNCSPNSTSFNATDRYQHQIYEPHQNGIESLHLLGIDTDYITTEGSKNGGSSASSKFFDYRTMETICNADTLKLGSDLYLRSNSKYHPSYSSVTNLQELPSSGLSSIRRDSNSSSGGAGSGISGVGGTGVIVNSLISRKGIGNGGSAGLSSDSNSSLGPKSVNLENLETGLHEKLHSTNGYQQNDKIISGGIITGYTNSMNITNVSPPSAFSDTNATTTTTNSLLNLMRQERTIENGSNNSSNGTTGATQSVGNTKYVRSPRDYTIAV